MSSWSEKRKFIFTIQARLIEMKLALFSSELFCIHSSLPSLNV
ncbi:hypothetical protein QWZ13_03820 [Reinekea marina]|nr:hypothetical protein [Reinekea marina]MDN3648030.1 hypothetical protein [Reinekea marina]